jgi:RES domain
LASLAEPPDDCRGFPVSSIGPTHALYRIHRAVHQPWWFSSERFGRFNKEPPHGTCYLSVSPVGAFVEVFGHIGRVEEADVLARRLAILQLPGPIRLADCTSPRAAGYGATAAIHTSEDYGLTRRWAKRFQDAGFEGVRYFCGYDPSQSEIAVAIFGDAGLGSWPADASGPIPAPLLEEIEATYGLRVWPTP